MENLKSQGSVREKILSGKSGPKLINTVSERDTWSEPDYLLVLTLLTLCILFWFWIMHYCIPTPTTHNNTSTGMIWVMSNIEHRQECRKMSGDFTLSGEWCSALLQTALESMQCSYRTPRWWQRMLKVQSRSLRIWLPSWPARTPCHGCPVTEKFWIGTAAATDKLIMSVFLTLVRQTLECT